MESNGSERREFFRIKDQVIISMTKIANVHNLNNLKNNHTSFLLGSAISALDLEAQAVFNRIKRSNPEVSQYFDVINKKINLISDHLLNTSPDNAEQKKTEVNLSASGIAIESDDEKYQEADNLLIKLLLLPERKGIICVGKIIRTKTINNKRVLCIDFSEISEPDRELIVKHTISRQLEQARNKNDYDQ